MKNLKKLVKRFIPESILAYRYSYLQLKRRKVLKFEVHVTDHCNLNCKGCDHFSPLAEENYLNVDFFERDCARISILTKGQVQSVTLLGGEPLLHPRLTDLFSIIRKYFDNTSVNILTNGTLLLQQTDDFWTSCKKYNIKINITRYPIKIDHNKIESLAKQYSVDLGYTGGLIKEMWRIPFDINGVQNVKYNFKKCFRANVCIFLQDGKLYTCPMIPCIKHFNKYFNQDLHVSENDYLDIYRVKSIDEIFDFLCKPIPFCRYCNYKEAVMGGIKWSISKKDISEWT
jgi:MoaA/NifB/PqqE/SkfB family radical SAM enzyme